MAAAELDQLNPFDPAVLQCPFPHYAAMRDEAPVIFLRNVGMWFVTRYDLVLEVAKDHKTYSNLFGGASMPLPAGDAEKLRAAMEEGYPRVSTMLTADQPEHTRYRRLVSKAFSARAIADLEPEIRRITTMLIDRWIDSGRVEFVSEFAVGLPVRVIARALNVPDDRLDDFKRWSDDSIAGIGTNITVDERVEAERGVNEFQHYFAAELDKRRLEPQDDLLTQLLNARVDDEDAEVTDRRPLDVPEMLSIIQQLLVAGNETTTKMLTEMMKLLAEHPDQWAKLKADPSRVPAVVEETLRLATPTQGMFRIVTRDVELGGVPIPAGARLVIVYSSANRDEAIFGADPDGFDPDRPSLGEHLAFGKGIHFCVGASLSRLEGRIALAELVQRIESFTLADANDFEVFPSFLLRGLKRLELDIVPVKEEAA
jgi:cytochrome P450